MNKKGFTLVELLTVIVLLVIISLISVYSISKARHKINEGLLEDKIQNIEAAGVLYGEDNRDVLEFPCVINKGQEDEETIEHCNEKPVFELLNSGYLVSEAKDEDFINDLTGKSMKCDTVNIFIKNNRVYAQMNELYSNDSEEDCSLGD